MNKIIIVGHPASGLGDVESLLLRCGMKSSLPSRRDGLLPKDVTGSICKAHQAPRADSPTDESDFQQIEPGSVWNGMALDLLLGNLDQDLWGWADSQTLFLLDYWYALDPQATFVFTYDEPQRVLTETGILDTAVPDELAVQQRLENWVAYNGAMLGFYLRHKDRCLLVHSRQVCSEVNQYLDQLQARLSAPLHASDPVPVIAGTRSGSGLVAAPFGPSSLTAAIERNLEAVSVLAGLQRDEVAGLLSAREAEHFIIDQYMSGHPGYLRLYEELQASANIPLDVKTAGSVDSRTAWKALVAQRQFSSNVLDKLFREHEDLRADTRKAAGEREVLLTQLQHVQEELESAFIGKKKLEDDTAQQQKALETLNDTLIAVQQEKHALAEIVESHRAREAARLTGAADRVKQQLGYRLGSTIVRRSRSFNGWLGMPFALIGETRDFQRSKPVRQAAKLPPISEYGDKDEAEKIRQQLSYRLGQTLLKNIRSPIGWIKLPFAMGHEISDFNRTRSRRQPE